MKPTTCEWGSCTALATTSVDYPAVVPGTARAERDWQLGTEPLACCDDCASVARAEVAAMGHDRGGMWRRVRHYRAEDGIVGYQDGDILIDDSTGEHSLAVRDARGVVLRPLTIGHRRAE